MRRRPSWSATWTPWGAAHTITGSATLNARSFLLARLRQDGQWYQLGPVAGGQPKAQAKTAGLHYNWHRSYDPTIGRYTQPDPLGFVDGPSVYGSAGGLPQSLVDPDELAPQSRPSVPWTPIPPMVIPGTPDKKQWVKLVNEACEVIWDFVLEMASKGSNVVDTQIQQDWLRDGAPKDKCPWLRENASRYRPDQVKATEKALGLSSVSRE